VSVGSESRRSRSSRSALIMARPGAALRLAQVRGQGLQQPAHQLGVAAVPAVLHVQVHHRTAHVREAQPQLGGVAVLALAHHEDAVGPLQQLAVDGVGGEGRGAGGAHLVAGVAGVERLGGGAAVHIGGADEQDALGLHGQPSLAHCSGAGAAC
jgi:hypothetical protein